MEVIIDISNCLGQPDPVASTSGRGGARAGSGRKRVVNDPERLTVDFERADLNALRALADDRGTSVASLVRKAVEQFLRRAGAR